MKEIKLKRRPPAHEIVLRALQEGLTVKLGDTDYIMQDNEIGIKVTCYKSEIGQDFEEKFMPIDLLLNYFMKLCNSLTDTEIFYIFDRTMNLELKHKIERNKLK